MTGVQTCALPICEQWEKLLAMSDQIREFILANDQALKKKE